MRKPHYIKQYFALLVFITCAAASFAQQTSLGNQLKDFHDAYWSQENFDMSPVESYLRTISEKDIEEASDSTRYYYHYWMGSIYAKQEKVDLEREHLKKSIAIRESSVGILDPEYIELLWELGSISEEIDVDKSIAYYQKALVIGQTILYNKEVSPYNNAFMQNTYGMVLGDLARMYEKKNWKDRVVGLYESAFSFRSQFYDKDDANCYVDMYGLAGYYRERKEYDKAVETMQKVVNYINNNGGYGTNSYVNASFMLASAMSQNNQHRDAENLYRSTIKLTLDSLGTSNKNLHLLYGNYCVELANNDSFEELDKTLPEAYHYYLQSDSLSTYINLLFTLSNNLCNKNAFEKAGIYNDSLFNYTSYMPYFAIEMLYSQKTRIELGKNNVPEAILWKQKEIEIERSEGISDKVYYLSALSELATLNSYSGDLDKALNVYQQVIDGIHTENLEEQNLYEQCVMFVCNLYHIQEKANLQEDFLNSQKGIMEGKNLHESRIYAQICNNLSVLQMKKNLLDEASKNNTIAERLFLKHYGRQSDNYATALHNKGRILMLQGKHKQALKYLLESKQLQMEINGSVYPNTDKYIQELEKK